MRVVALGTILLLAGCVGPRALVPPLGDPGPSDWSFEAEPAMAPDFTGQGETYPVLLVHKHHLASERQREEWRRNPVVCLLGGVALVATAAAAPCAGPPADPATGRLYTSRAVDGGARRFEAEGALVDMTSCGTGITELAGASTHFYAAPGHDFAIEFLPNRTFTVDGVWIAPRTALKAAYFLHAGSAYDEEYVRVAFEHPGEWLRERAKPYEPDVDREIRPRLEQGTGLVAELALSPSSLREPIQALVAATPAAVTGLVELRIVHDGERLTEVRAALETASGTVTWTSAGRVGDRMRVLGAQVDATSSVVAVPIDAVLDRADLSWRELAAGAPGDMVDVRLASDRAIDAALVAPSEAELPCDGACAFRWTQAPLAGGAWARVFVPEPREAEGALTYRVVVHAEAGEETDVWWHVPAAG